MLLKKCPAYKHVEYEHVKKISTFHLTKLGKNRNFPFGRLFTFIMWILVDLNFSDTFSLVINNFRECI